MRRALALGVPAVGLVQESMPLIHVDAADAATRMRLAHPRREPRRAGRRRRPRAFTRCAAGEELGGPNAVGTTGRSRARERRGRVRDRPARRGRGLRRERRQHGRRGRRAARAKTRSARCSRISARSRARASTRRSQRRARRRHRVGRGARPRALRAKLAVRTRYTLHATRSRALARDDARERGDQPVDMLGLGDAIQWGGAEKIAPGRGRGFQGRVERRVHRRGSGASRATRSRRRMARSTARAAARGPTRSSTPHRDSRRGKACTIHAYFSWARARTSRASSRS